MWNINKFYLFKKMTFHVGINRSYHLLVPYLLHKLISGLSGPLFNLFFFNYWKRIKINQKRRSRGRSTEWAFFFERAGHLTHIHLIPEVCFMTGLRWSQGGDNRELDFFFLSFFFLILNFQVVEPARGGMFESSQWFLAANRTLFPFFIPCAGEHDGPLGRWLTPHSHPPILQTPLYGWIVWLWFGS